MPKTGTKSLSAALRILGYNVYDYEEQLYYLGPAMTKATREGLTIEEFRNTFENIDTFTDVPACVFFEELHEAFPDAKVSLFTTEPKSSGFSKSEYIFLMF